MQFIDLQTFKTKRCNKTHNELNYSASFFNCEMYHSKSDKRRNPFLDNKKQFLYGQIYIEDFYSTQMASNFVQYLYHPNVYKTIQCKYRNNINYDPALQYIGHCPYIYCPYLHQNQDVTALKMYRNLKLNNNPQPISNDLKITSEVIQMLKLPKSQFDKAYKKEINSVKNQLKNIQLQYQKQKNQKLEGVEVFGGQNLNNKMKEMIKLQANENWYIPYQQFYFGQKLTLIQSRYHQFKNYRDIIKNTITPTVMKGITAFLNNQGGVMYIGIDDRSVVHGFEITQQQFDKFLLSIDKEGKFDMSPPLMPQKYSIRRIPVLKNKKSKQLWVLEIKAIPLQRQKKNKVLHTYKRQCYMRMNASTHKLDAMDIFQYIRLNQEEKQENKNKKEQLQIILKSFDMKSKMLQIQSQQLVSMKQIISKMNQKIDSILLQKKKKSE